MDKETLNIIKGTEHPEEFSKPSVEAQEKIATLLVGFFGRSMEYNMPQARILIYQLEELGYHKPFGEEKPPLLKVEQTTVHTNLYDDGFNAGAQAQREADIKYFTGGK